MDKEITADYHLPAERSFISALLNDRQVAEYVEDPKFADYFYHPQHVEICKIAARLLREKQPINETTISSNLPIVDYSQFTQFVSDPVESYVDVIKEKARNRKLRCLLQSVQRTLGVASSDSVLDEINAGVHSLLVEKTDDTLRAFSSSIDKAIEKIIEAQHAKDGIVGRSTGLKAVDKATGGLRGGELIVVAGRPGSGKSSLAFEWLSHCASLGYGAIGFSLEMPSDTVALRIACSKSNICLSAARNGTLTTDEFRKLSDCMENLRKLPLVLDDKPAATLADFRKGIRRSINDFARRGIALGIVVVDYIQLMRALEGGNREQEISAITRGLKAMSKEFDVPIVALSQLNRQVEQREDKRPMMSDLRDSGGIEQDADIIMMIYRHDYYNANSAQKGVAELIIQKHRNGEVGTIYAAFDGKYTRFRDLTLAERAKAGLPGK